MTFGLFRDYGTVVAVLMFEKGGSYYLYTAHSKLRKKINKRVIFTMLTHLTKEHLEKSLKTFFLNIFGSNGWTGVLRRRLRKRKGFSNEPLNSLFLFDASSCTTMPGKVDFTREILDKNNGFILNACNLDCTNEVNDPEEVKSQLAFILGDGQRGYSVFYKMKYTDQFIDALDEWKQKFGKKTVGETLPLSLDTAFTDLAEILGIKRKKIVLD